METLNKYERGSVNHNSSLNNLKGSIMKRLTIYLFIVVCTVTAPVLGYSGGTGEPNDPYQIATAQDLIDLGNTPQDYDKHFILIADIDLSGQSFTEALIAPDTDSSAWGFQGLPFTGVFDGQGYSVKQLHITGDDYLGLFGQSDPNAIISNLGVQAVDVNGTDDYIGGLVGDNYGSLINCYSIGTVTGVYFAGGLVGNNYGSLIDCYSTSTVTGGYDAGGLVGNNVYGSLINCYSTGAVTGYGFFVNSIGGLVGTNNYGSLLNCHSNCTVTGDFYVAYVGGLVGENNGGILSCYSIGTVTGDYLAVGGLVGANNYGILYNCYSTAVATGGDGAYAVGGLVGKNGDTVSNCYSTGTVTGGIWAYVGGLVGDNDFGSFSCCYSTGTVSGIITGGLVGNNTGIVSNCFWDTQTSGLNFSMGGTDLTTMQMQDPNTFLNAGWDLTREVSNGTNNVWHSQTGGYPMLAVFAGIVPVEPSGTGTTSDPYLIADANDLGFVWFQPSACYRMDRDIDLAGITWGTAVIPWFGGTFDANEYKIRHLHIQGGNSLGLFGQLGSIADISNLGLIDVDVNGPDGSFYIGGLAGINRGAVTNCYGTGTVKGDSFVGGLVGFGNGILSRCCSAGTITGYSFVGGIMGKNGGLVSNCYSTGNVTATDLSGGLVGTNNGGISNCYSTGAVTGSQDIGGLVGDNWGSVTNCFWDKQTSGLSVSEGGTGFNTVQMQSQQTYLNAGWDFVGETQNGTDDIWQMSAATGYPEFY
jgi:hypothetical protein